MADVRKQHACPVAETKRVTVEPRWVTGGPMVVAFQPF